VEKLFSQKLIHIPNKSELGQVDSSASTKTIFPSILVKRHKWFTQTVHEANEKVGELKTSCGVSLPPRKFPDYVALMSSIIDSKPCNYEEGECEKVWWDAMLEEYNYILKNDVWEIISRPVGKLVIDSKWLYKVKHAIDGSIEK